MDVRVALDAAKFVDTHAAGAADATEVIAFEVDQHDVFRAFLGIALEFSEQSRIDNRIDVATARAGNRTRVHAIAADADQPLRR